MVNEQGRSREIEEELFHRADEEMAGLIESNVTSRTGVSLDESEIRCNSCEHYEGIKRFVDGTSVDSRQVVCNARGKIWVRFKDIEEYTKKCSYSPIGGIK